LPDFVIQLCLILASRNRAVDALPAQLTYRDFWKMIREFSEPDGALKMEIITSNEVSCRDVSHLEKVGAAGRRLYRSNPGAELYRPLRNAIVDGFDPRYSPQQYARSSDVKSGVRNVEKPSGLCLTFVLSQAARRDGCEHTGEGNFRRA